MHEIFLLVDFSVGLICFVMFKNRLHKDLYKKTQKQKKKRLKKIQVRRKCFILPFYKIYRLKICKHAHLVPAAFWPKPRAGLGPIANINHQHLLLLLVALCECVLTFSL